MSDPFFKGTLVAVLKSKVLSKVKAAKLSSLLMSTAVCIKRGDTFFSTFGDKNRSKLEEGKMIKAVEHFVHISMWLDIRITSRILVREKVRKSIADSIFSPSD